MAVPEHTVCYLEIVTPDVEEAERRGAEIALGVTEIPGQGTIAIYLLGGVQQGLWQLS